MLNEIPFPNRSSPSAKRPNLPETLEHRVNTYTLARHHEALIGKDRTKVGRAAAFNFLSALRHCPCGKDLPCPDHGDFSRRFFEVSPDHADYFEPLQKKKLPFTPIYELLAREAEKSEPRAAPDLDAK
jgi:hypothetical protein